MTCDRDTLRCSIDELGGTLTSFNWNEVLATTIATLAGVLIGALIAFLASRREARVARERRNTEAEDRRQARIDVALERVIWEINQHAVALRGVWERQQADRPEPEWLPQDFGVLASIAAARMIAKTQDEKDVLNAIRDLVIEVRIAEIRKRVDGLTLVWRTLILWREGAPAAEVTKDLNELQRSTTSDAPIPT